MAEDSSVTALFVLEEEGFRRIQRLLPREAMMRTRSRGACTGRRRTVHLLLRFARFFRSSINPWIKSNQPRRFAA